MDKVSAPPGFVSHTSFWLQNVQRNEDDCEPAGCSEEARASSGGTSGRFDIEELRNSFEHKPWLLYNQGNYRQIEPDGEQDENSNMQQYLSKGVTRGCPDCSHCQKVSARWRPEDAHTTLLEDAPVYYPTDEEFKDMPKYIASIRTEAECCGVCRIVPPYSWVQSCHVPEGAVLENSTLSTLIQDISELHVDITTRKNSIDTENITGKKRKISGHRFENGAAQCADFGSKRFQFSEGPKLSIKEFKKSAIDFRLQYFDNKNKGVLVSSTAPSNDVKLTVDKIEGEYWRIIENPTESLEVLAGATMDTRTSTTVSKVHETTVSKLLKSGWNLQNDSLLTFETNNSLGVLYPQLYFGMCFSSLCWKVEDSLLYSLYYLHVGAHKVWYVIPGRYFLKFQAIVKKYYPDMVSDNPEMLYKLVRQLPISALKSEGIPVYRCIQPRSEFVVIFPGAYHSAFDCGFNCVELCNYASIDWLPYSHLAMELCSGLEFKSSISADKLMLKASNEAVKALWKLSLTQKDEVDPNLLKWKSFTGKDGILVKALKIRTSWIESRRKYLCNFSQTKKMDSNFDAEDKRECCVCHYDLYLAAVGCSCSADRFTCLNHARQLCVCPWHSRVLLVRYDICQLKLLVQALEGKLSAIYKWAKESLGLLVQSHVDPPVRNHQSPAESSESSSQSHVPERAQG